MTDTQFDLSVAYAPERSPWHANGGCTAASAIVCEAEMADTTNHILIKRFHDAVYSIAGVEPSHSDPLIPREIEVLKIAQRMLLARIQAGPAVTELSDANPRKQLDV